ncbi:MAG: hypothetical protein GY906_37190 [bacterium]|nr:hypothetical protein [bacterium]
MSGFEEWRDQLPDIPEVDDREDPRVARAVAEAEENLYSVEFFLDSASLKQGTPFRVSHVEHRQIPAEVEIFITAYPNRGFIMRAMKDMRGHVNTNLR